MQHPDIARFRGGVINTMRLITFDTEGGATAGRRLAAHGDFTQEHRQLDAGRRRRRHRLDKGILKPFGIVKKDFKVVEAHPGSGLCSAISPFRIFIRR